MEAPYANSNGFYDNIECSGEHIDAVLAGGYSISMATSLIPEYPHLHRRYSASTLVIQIIFGTG